VRVPQVTAAAALAALAVLCLCAPAANAQNVPAYTHEGLFVRLQGGLGYLRADADYLGGNSSAYGGSGVLGLAVGGNVAENVVLYGELWGMAAANPTVQFLSATHVLQDASLNYGGLGVGLGTFLMPANVFLGVSLSLTRLGVTDADGTRTNSDIGLAVSATLGKQWWVSRHAGLGLSVTVVGGGNHDDNNDANSATYKTFAGFGALVLTFG
jgi:hypothetical protein